MVLVTIMKMSTKDYYYCVTIICDVNLSFIVQGILVERIMSGGECSMSGD